METTNSGPSKASGVKKIIDGIIRAYLDGGLQVKDVASALATHLEADSAQEILNGLVDRGRLGRDEADEITREFFAARSAENGIAGATATAAGGTAAVSAVAMSGSIGGLSASGITSGLAALGGLIGGGMASGLVVTAGAAFVAGAGVFVMTKQLLRRTRQRKSERLAEIVVQEK